MTTITGPENIRQNVFIPPDVYERIVKAAHENERSVHREILFMLKTHYTEENKAKK